MPLNIRDERAATLARDLAARRNTTITEAVISALESALRADRACIPLSTRLSSIVQAAKNIGISDRTRPATGSNPLAKEL